MANTRFGGGSDRVFGLFGQGRDAVGRRRRGDRPMCVGDHLRCQLIDHHRVVCGLLSSLCSH